MFEVPQVMQTAQRMARHAGAAQTQVAKNMANSDTPGFRGQAVATFNPYESGFQIAARTTRVDHIPSRQSASIGLVPTTDSIDSNGNNVSIESEMLRGASAQSQHTTAVTVYKASLDLLRTALGRGR